MISARVLVLADRLPRRGLRPDDRRMVQLLGELARVEPQPEVTLVSADWVTTGAGPSAAPAAVRTVSHADDWGAWFEDQRADVVIVHGVRAQARFGTVLAATQPRALRIVDGSALESPAGSSPAAPLDDEDAARAVALDAATTRDRAAVADAGLVVCASDHEATLVRALDRTATTTVARGYVVPRPDVPPPALRRGSAFVGSFVDGASSPDEDAALFLAEEVVTRAGASEMLHVLGEDATPVVRALAGSARFHVASGSLVPWLDRVRAVLAVRRWGRPVPAGLHAAVVAGAPIVASTRVATWCDLPTALAAGDDPGELAAAIAELGDDSRWEHACSLLADWAEEALGAAGYRAALRPLLAEVGTPDRRPPARTELAARGHGRWHPDPEHRAAGVAPLVPALAEQVESERAAGAEHPVTLLIDPGYDEWFRELLPTPRRRWEQQAHARALPHRPLVSILVPIGDGGTEALDRTVASLCAQSYEHWELILAPTIAAPAPVLARLGALAADPRVRIVPAETGTTSGGALGPALGRARGEYTGPLRAGDELEPNALLEAMTLVNRCPALDLLYTDEHERTPDGAGFCHPALKPSWSPDLLLSLDYLGRLVLVRTELARAVGGFDPALGDASEYDLWLRVSEVSDRVGHVAQPLCRTAAVPASPLARGAARVDVDRQELAAVAASLDRRREPAAVESLAPDGRHRVRYAVIDRPLVSIVVPTRDGRPLLEPALRSIRERSTYQSIEIVIVDNDSRDPATLELLDEHDGPVLRYPFPFNYARMMNLGIAEASGDLVLLLNDDVEVFQADWLEAMAEHAQRASVGAVGARLWYPSGMPQHQGVFLGGGVAAVNASYAEMTTRYDDWHLVSVLGSIVTNASAVTGACLMARPSVLAEVGGLDERLHVAFNDVDLCLKLRARGYDVVVTPFSTLVHRESATRGSSHPMENDARFRRRWRIHDDYGDPFCNPNYDQRRRFALHRNRVP